MNTFSKALLLIIVASLLASCSFRADKKFVYDGTKMKGVSFVAPRDSLSDSCYVPVRLLNAEWVSLMPYGFCEAESPNFVYGRDNQWKWWGESPKGVAHCVEMAHAKGLKVMLKPHLWIGHGVFTGHFDLKSEQDWQIFEKRYGDYLLDFARIADSTDVELYCIATEMQTFVKKRPEFWSRIIKEIKTIYKGKLTYAENWDAYADVPFWKELDYVGVDAYFPLSEGRAPTVTELRKGWKAHKAGLEKLSGTLQKPILFTEFGYVSTDFAAKKPWENDRSLPENEALQAAAYTAVFEEVWTEEWMAGGFVWKWFPMLQPGNRARDPFSPQHKAAEHVLRTYFGKDASAQR
ncbi:glycoside hydrolase family 113 [Arundinibacter roseus]|uniref:Glycoside hydrolase n=1 Tax=Arundinibacter roseus TaxID=2070510 RepID=A0A4R4KDK1_9BACT|nr:hypothetical protein [Arundinibacter roseus]TDB64601.1 hypothetical protein EZE20_13095 [Arundinibacter roseus]